MTQTNQSTQSTEQFAEKSFFNLTVDGLGYLNNIKQVKTENGSSFIACVINALSGSTEAPEYTRFDVTVSGKQVSELVSRCIKAVSEEKKVLIGFRLSNLKADTFVYNKGDKAGETMISMKARLIKISWIKIGKEMVYKTEGTVNPNLASTEVQAKDFPEDSF